MSRPFGSKNKKTITHEAQQAALLQSTPIDMLHIMERAAVHFFTRAEMRKQTGKNPELVDADCRTAAELAAHAAPYRHARLKAITVEGTINPSDRFRDDANLEELRAEVTRRLADLSEEGVIDLTALPAPKRETAN